MLHKLQVVCENNCKVRGPTGQCNWTGEYSEYQKHRASCQNLQSAEGPASDSQHEPASSSTALEDLQPEAPDNTQQQPPQMHVRFKQGDQWCSPEVVLRAPPLGSMNPLEGGTFSKLDLHKPPRNFRIPRWAFPDASHFPACKGRAEACEAVSLAVTRVNFLGLYRSTYIYIYIHGHTCM